MSKKFIFITTLLTLLSLGVEGGIGWVAGIVGSVFDILLIGFFVTAISGFISKKDRSFGHRFLRNSLFCWSILGGFSSLLLSFAFLANAFPGSLSSIHLTDGKRQIVFMQMSHIGTRAYYDRVNHTLRDLTASGYTIYREWVFPGTKENTDRFDRTLGVKISSGTYADFASFIGLVAQDDQIFSGISSGSIRSVDLTLDQIVALMGTGEVLSSDPPIDPTLELESLRDAQSWPLLWYILRWVLNFTLSHISGTDIIFDTMNPRLREAILSKRNKHVVDTILADEKTNIVILYGALHFEGIYELLHRDSPLWKIGTIEPYYPYKK